MTLAPAKLGSECSSQITMKGMQCAGSSGLLEAQGVAQIWSV